MERSTRPPPRTNPIDGDDVECDVAEDEEDGEERNDGEESGRNRSKQAKRTNIVIVPALATAVDDDGVCL